MAQTFGQVLQGLRQQQGLTVYALAQQAGLSAQTVHDLERLQREPHFDTVRRLAAVLGIGLDGIASQLPPVSLPLPYTGRPRGRPRQADRASAGGAAHDRVSEG